MTSAPRKLGIGIEDRIYMKIGNFTFKVRQGEFQEESVTEASESGIQPIWLGFQKRKVALYVELTGMTTEELALFERGISEAIAAAREVIAVLDEQAAGEYDTEQVIPLRALRTSPVCVFRPIRPFIGTDRDPVGPAEVKEYGDEMEPMNFL